MGRRVRRMVRRATREVERTVRRATREVGNITESVLGSVPIVGDVLGGAGLLETPGMKATEQEIKRAEEQQARLDKMASDQRAEEEWTKQQQQAQAQIGQTQLDSNTGGLGTGAVAGLEGEDVETVDGSEDKLKKLLKKKI